MVCILFCFQSKCGIILCLLSVVVLLVYCGISLSIHPNPHSPPPTLGDSNTQRRQMVMFDLTDGCEL